MKSILSVRGLDKRFGAVVALACHGRHIVDMEALRAQQEMLRTVASDTTMPRAMGEISAGRRAATGRARAAARAHAWSLLPAAAGGRQVSSRNPSPP